MCAYICVFDEFIHNYGLTGNELLIYSVIHGYSQANAGCFWGDREYLATRLGIGKNTVIRALASLEDKGLISKRKGVNPEGKPRFEYQIVEHSEESTQNGYLPKMGRVSTQNGYEKVPKMGIDTYIDNKIDNKTDNKRKARTREEILSDLKDDFRTKVEQFRGQYSDAMLEDFIGYWCEPFQNPVGQKFLRWQGEKTWDMSRRLRTWAQREVRYKPHVKTVPVLTPQQEEKKRRDEEYIARMNETSEEAQGPGNRIMDERKERMRIALETSKQRAREQYELEDIQAGELHSVDRKRGDGIVDIMGRKV